MTATEPAPPGIPAYRCNECRATMILNLVDGEAVCNTSWCAALAMPIKLWRAERQRTGDLLAGGTAAGWPRPVLQGRPVPWITPAIGGHVWWRDILPARIQACQQHWACQVCGLPLNTTAYALVTASGRLASDAAMHQRCVQLAQKVCPAVPRSAMICVPIDAGSIVVGDAALSDIHRREWSIRLGALSSMPEIGVNARVDIGRRATATPARSSASRRRSSRAPDRESSAAARGQRNHPV